MRENKEEEINIENSLKVEIENMKILPPKPRKKKPEGWVYRRDQARGWFFEDYRHRGIAETKTN